MITKEDQVPLFVELVSKHEGLALDLELITEAQTAAVVIKVLLNTLQQIASEKRNTQAKLNAKATLNFIHSQTKDKYKELIK